MPLSPAQKRRADLLAKVPASAERVLVETAEGDRKYKAPADLAETDVIQTKKNGDPIVMKAKPGRKTPVVVAPANDTVAEILRRKREALDNDPVLKTVSQAPDSPDVLHEVIRGLSEEQASLKFARQEAERKGEDTSTLSSRRVQALRATADTWLKRADQLGGSLVDLDSPAYAALFKYTMGTLRNAMIASRMRDEEIEMVFTRFASTLEQDEWKQEAVILMKKASHG